MLYDQHFIEELIRRPVPSYSALEARHQKHLERQSVAKNYQLADLTLHCPSGVYHPEVGSSSLFMLSHLLRCDLGYAPDILEMGVGCGVIILGLAKRLSRGGFCGVDISLTAVDSFAENAERNGINVHAIESDLFDKIPLHSFDNIIFNPPLLDKETDNEMERTMLCDPGARILKKFLLEAPRWIKPSGTIYISMANIGDLSVIDNLPYQYEWICAEMLPNGSVRAIMAIPSQHI